MSKCRMVAARLTKDVSRLTVACWSGTRRLGAVSLYTRVARHSFKPQPPTASSSFVGRGLKFYEHVIAG